MNASELQLIRYDKGTAWACRNRRTAAVQRCMRWPGQAARG